MMETLAFAVDDDILLTVGNNSQLSPQDT